MEGPRRPSLSIDELLHPRERDQFSARCLPTDPAEFGGLRLRVIAHLRHIEAAAHADAPTDVDTARRVAAVLTQLLDEPHTYAEGERALLRGAVEYFVLADDEVDDERDLVGFDDDVRVTNGVLAAIGRADLRIELGV